ncbi:MAG: hypothetical protein J6S83_09780 [Lachnospiraceae bacterium]|nr:hypothetical protein [Lachnospiraceae bacterium]
MKHYSTFDREKAIFAFVMGLIAIIFAAWLAFAPIEEHQAPDVVYPMVNQHITWEGAGYSGIYAKGGEQ